MKFLFTGILSILFISMFAQDECANAPTLVLDPSGNACKASHFTIPLPGATISTTTPLPTCGWGTGKRDVWYKCVVPAGVTKMSLGLGNTAPLNGLNSRKPCMAVYRGSCAALTQISCYTTPSGGLSFATRGFSFKNVTVVPGETLYFRMWEQGSYISMNFDLMISTTQTAPSNSSCSNAAPLGSIGCNVNAPGGGMTAPDQCDGRGSEGATWGSVDNIVFYNVNVTPTTLQPLSITLYNVTCAGGCNEIQLALYRGPCSNAWGSNVTSPPNPNFLGCNQGVGTVTVTAIPNSLPVGNYILAVDGCSDGIPVQTSACIFGITSSAILLPVELAEFKAFYDQGGDFVRTNWTTLSEKNSAVFLLERSEDGINFQAIGQVEAAGFSNRRIDYTFDDHDLPGNKLVFYYRLKQIDLDGSIAYSDMVMVYIHPDSKLISVYPNPVTDGYLKADIQNFQDRPVILNVFDPIGKLVFSKQWIPQNQLESFSLPVHDFANGMYQYQLSDEAGHLQAGKMIVANQ